MRTSLILNEIDKNHVRMGSIRIPIMLGGAEAVAIIDGIPGTELIPITLFMIFVPYAVWGWVKAKKIEEQEKTKRLEKMAIRGEKGLGEVGDVDGEETKLKLPDSIEASPQRRINHAIENGWKVKSESPERAILTNRNYGSRKKHLIILLITFWTYGLGNLIYGIYSMKKYSDVVVVGKNNDQSVERQKSVTFETTD